MTATLYHGTRRGIGLDVDDLEIRGQVAALLPLGASADATWGPE